jgi:uncharacterized protein (DUF1330 family)
MSTLPLSRRQLAALEALPPERPIIMLNLLRFREQAVYPESRPETPCSGREAYRRYSATAVKTLASVGGKLVLGGTAGTPVIAPADERWDQVLLVRYPAVAAFLRMMAMPDYQAAVHHRLAALEDSRLIPILTDEESHSG